MEKRKRSPLVPGFQQLSGYNQEIWGQRFLEESGHREHRLKAIGISLISRSGFLSWLVKH